MTQIPHADKGSICPLHRVDMSKVCHRCPWWTRVVGKNPQSEEMIDRWQCAIAWLPILLIENSQQQHQTKAAVETFRNNVVEAVQARLSRQDDVPLLNRR
jgi:hypothetical protein